MTTRIKSETILNPGHSDRDVGPWNKVCRRHLAPTNTKKHKMDVNHLHDCFLGALQADPAVRKQAETQLANFSHNTGFLAACIDIISNDSVQPIVKQSCSIYFKNIILKNWTIGNLLDNDERPIIRERLLQSIIKLDRILRNQLLPALSLIVKYDYPSNWPELMEHIMNLINASSESGDFNSLYVGIYSFAEICRNYRWKQNKERSSNLDPIIVNCFPTLLSIGTKLMNDPKLAHSYEASEILKLIIKCYKFSVYLDFPAPLQESQALVDWITFQVNIINAPYTEDSQEGWIKAQKWSYFNLYRLFQKFGTKTISSKYDYPEFRNNFKANVLPQLMSVYMDNLKNWIAGSKYLPETNLYYLIQLFEQCLLKKDTFKLIEPHFNFIIVDVAFKIFNPKEEDLELFEDEPEEYIHKIFDLTEENTAEDSLHSFLFTLVEKRIDYLAPMFQYIVSKFGELNGAQETLEVARGKESLMKFLSPISYKLSESKNPVYSEVEPFLNNFIIPNFESQFPFVRARTCNLVSKFDNLEMQQDGTIQNLFKGIMQSFLDESSSLPIQVQAALAIQAFIINETFKQLASEWVLKTMEKLMDLNNKFDSEVIPAVMQELVESYPAQLEPFAEQLMEQLTMKLITLLKSINEIANSNNSDDYDELESVASEKTSTSLGILNTMITILLYFENSTEIIGKLETHYSKAIKIIFDDKIDDFYAEAGELIENTLFLTRSVSPIMWSLLKDFVDSIMSDGDITLYLEDALPALKNYLIYGGDVVKQSAEVQQLYMNLIMGVFNMAEEDEDEDMVGFTDIGHISDLATTFVLSLDSNVSGQYLPMLINNCIKCIGDITKKMKNKGISNKIQLLNVIVAALVIDPNTTLRTLIENGTLEGFFTVWFELNASFKRVFDLKLSILGYISLLSIDYNSLNSMMLATILPVCGNNLSQLLFNIPTAMKDLEKRREEYSEKTWDNELTYKIDQVRDDDDEGDDGNFVSIPGASGEGDDDDEEYEYLFDNSKQFSFDDIDELNEDPYSNSCLDKINVFDQIKNFMITVQTNEADKYNATFGGLSNEDKETLSNILSNL